MTLTFDDSRRLTGPNFFAAAPGVVLDAYLGDVEVAEAVAAWERHVWRLLHALGWIESEPFSRPFRGGASLGFTAPEDALYAAAEVNEAAWACAAAELQGDAPPDEADTLARLRAEIDAERTPAIPALRAAAEARGVAFVPDDEEVSVGLGTGSRTWPLDAIPAPDAVDWADVHDIPVGLVTGTNGKSTTVRLTAAIVQAAGRTAGQCSTDFVRVGEAIVERGDFSGPGGARTVLRHRDVEVAVLETARGGLLRRGLALDRADAALVTNVAEDHLGDYGIHTLDELIEAKMTVRRAVEADGVLLLNADDEGLRAWIESHGDYGGRLGWFSLNPDHPALATCDGPTCSVEDDAILLRDGDTRTDVLPVADVPITLGGAARHNVQNALAAVLLAHSLGLEPDAMRAGLRSFRGDTSDNPGRGNFFSIAGARVLLDFAHNEHAASAIAETARDLPAERRLLLLSEAGDRTDAEIRALARAAWQARPDHIVIAELPDYLRGRSLGEVPALLDDAFHTLGATEEHITHVPDPITGVRLALDWMRPGDLLLLFVLSRRDEAVALLREAQHPAG